MSIGANEYLQGCLNRAEKDLPLLIGGGFSTTLEHYGVALDTELWSAAAIIHHPDKVRQAHREVIDAGADIIMTGTYQMTHAGLRQAGMASEDTAANFANAVGLARQAITDQTWNDQTATDQALLGGSLGSYGAYLADGSEYRGGFGLSVHELTRFHQPQWQTLCSLPVDFIAFETISDGGEVRAIAALVAGQGVPVWLSMTTMDGLALGDGTPLQDAAAWVAGVPEIFALGINCAPPAVIRTAIDELGAVSDKKLVAYANSGETWDGNNRCWQGGVTFFDHVAEWSGLWAVGGCCRILPEQTARLGKMTR